MSSTPPDLLPATAGNPFSTRHIHPGAIEYLFSAGTSAQSLIAKLRDNAWRGEIVGPHGSGKSTLVATLLPLLERADRNVVHIAMHGGEHRLPISRAASRSWNHATQLVVDGYERLSWWRRRWLSLACQRRGAGLLVTAHESVGLPTLMTTVPTLDVMQAIVERLLPAGSTRISSRDVAGCFEQHGGNARETLFGLYDLYELRRGR